MRTLEDYMAFVSFCKEQGVLNAQMGDFAVSFEPSFDLGMSLESEEEEDEDSLFYSAEG